MHLFVFFLKNKTCAHLSCNCVSDVPIRQYYHIFSWGFPAIPVIILAALQFYGRTPSGFACYINEPSGVAVLVSFFVPGLLIVSANTVLFVFVAREIRETLKGAREIRGGGAERKDTKRQLRVYASIVFSIGMAWLFGFISVLFPSNGGTLVPFQIFDILFNVLVPLQVQSAVVVVVVVAAAFVVILK